MGAEVSGIDLSAPLSDPLFGEVREALHRHHVLVFRAQTLEPGAFLGFASRFGPPEPHLLGQFHHPQHLDIPLLSKVKENGRTIGFADGGTDWHTDYSCLEVPEAGGDTLFADQEQA